MNRTLINLEKFYIQNRKKLFKLAILIVVLLIIIIVISSIISGSKRKACNNLYEEINDIAYTYAEENKLLPTYNGESATIYLSDLQSVTYKDNVCKGTVKYTKYNDEYLKTYDISGCGNCNTGDDWGKETDSYKKGVNVNVIPYYNYYKVTTSVTPWSDWLPFEEIATEEKDGVLLPLNEKEIPDTPKEAIILEIQKEDATFYSYQDTKWKWYKNNSADVSGFSSTAPSGYPNKDTSSQRETEYTEWSQTYPDVHSEYRTIYTRTGYRWYKEEDGKKVYWQNGDFSVEEPGEGYKKDSKNQVKMYRYKDKEWRWYKTAKREYGYFTSIQPNSYPYKDTELVQYTNWTIWSQTSHLDSSNKGYRAEKTNVHSRYRVKYNMLSYIVYDNYITKAEFEKDLGKTVPELMEDETVQVDIKFKFQY